MNKEAIKCLLDGTNNFTTAMLEASQSPSRRFHSENAIICSSLSDTVGQCLKNPLPQCLSQAEKDFFGKYFRHQMKNLMEMVENLGINNNKTISLQSCSFLSSSENIMPTLMLISI